MPRFRVLITDYAWPDVEIERRILAAADAELVGAAAGDEPTLIGRAAHCDAILTNWAKTTARVIAASGRCQIVSRLGIGLDNIDVPWCTANGIPVTNVPDYCLIEVAEHAIALLLSLARKVALYHEQTQHGVYDLKAGPPLRRIEGQTVGIIGLGAIGRKFAQKCRALGLKTIAYSRSQKDPVAETPYVPLEELLARSDYVSLHLPLNGESRRMLGREQFAMMKPGSYLINTARGGILDHAALAEAIESGRLAGAALDVQDPEPPDLSQPPYNHPRVIVTPHAAFVSEESLADLRERAAKQVAARLHGKIPLHVVNPEWERKR